MKFDIARLVCILSVFALLTGCEGRKQINTDMLKDGDIIFQNKTSKHSEFINILMAPEYNHCGILLSKNNKWYVIEAAQPVELTPVSGWINSGEGGFYAVKRLKEADAVLNDIGTAKLKKACKEYLGKPYDIYFLWSDDSFYASELVWKVFNKALGIEICPLRALADFNLASAEVKEKIRDIYGNKVPLFEEMASPEDLFSSSGLITIIDNGN